MFRRVCATLALTLAATQANAVPLSDLLQGGRIQVGDKLFDMFTLISDVQQPIFGDPVDLSSIDVTGIGDGTPGNEYGLNFDYGIQLGSENPQQSDFFAMTFGYQVTVTQPGNQIVGITTAGDLSATGDDAFSYVFKDAFDLLAQDILPGDLQLIADTFIVGDQLSDSAAIAPHDAIFVVDAVQLGYSTFGGASVAALNSFEQRFIQVGREVPLPATLSLVLLGLLGLRRARTS